MISTFTLNAAIDKMYVIENFNVDVVNRVSEVDAQPGGKGNNVAKVARLLGADVTASGFIGGSAGQIVHNRLQARGIASDSVWIEAETRETLTIIDPIRRTQTEIREPGPEIRDFEWKQLRAKADELSRKSKVACFSGSLPKGLSSNAYAELIAIANEAGALTVLDASGDSLALGLESAPFMCKPNRDELSMLTGERMETVWHIVNAARSIIGKGVKLVVVSLDKEGSIIATASKTWHMLPPRIEAVNTVGCGDALVGGIAYRLDRLEREPCEQDFIEAVAWGTAAAASNALASAVGHVAVAELPGLLSKVTIREL